MQTYLKHNTHGNTHATLFLCTVWSIAQFTYLSLARVSTCDGGRTHTAVSNSKSDEAQHVFSPRGELKPGSTLTTSSGVMPGGPHRAWAARHACRKQGCAVCFCSSSRSGRSENERERRTRTNMLLTEQWLILKWSGATLWWPISTLGLPSLLFSSSHNKDAA